MQKLELAVMVMIIMALSACTMIRNSLWGDPVKFWDKNYQDYPGKARIASNYGNALMAAGKTEKAKVLFSKAIELDPTVYPPYYNLGTVYLSYGQYDEAIVKFNEALERVSNGVLTNADIHNNLGCALAMKQRLPEALEQFKRAYQINPYSKVAKDNIVRLSKVVRKEQ